MLGMQQLRRPMGLRPRQLPAGLRVPCLHLPLWYRTAAVMLPSRRPHQLLVRGHLQPECDAV